MEMEIDEIVTVQEAENDGNNKAGDHNEEKGDTDAFDMMLEVANTGFGDMLHDRERNIKYYEALRTTIKRMHSEGKQAHVLDIGTGTGLLSMMAVVCGADSVVACEAFLPMANCAEEIIKANNMAGKIKLIKKRSTELTVGPDGDMPRKANVLVAELLDTELIGEGAINIYNHALEELLSDDVLCIPSRARCYAQVVHSPLAAQWNSFKSLTNLDADILLSPPKNMSTCNANSIVQYVQLSQFPKSSFRPISAAVKIFDFNFMNIISTGRKKYWQLEALEAGSTDLVFFWWDIYLDPRKEILLSCAPYWAHPDLKPLLAENKCDESLWSLIPWRDHWMQAIYYIPKSINIPKKGTKFSLFSQHDEFSFWFDVAFDDKQKKLPIEKQFCTCSFHNIFPRTRIGQLNQSLRNKAFMKYLENEVKADSKVLVLSDGSALGVAIKKLGADQVIVLEPNQQILSFMQALVADNSVENIRFINDLQQLSSDELSKLTHVFGEPYFVHAILPWDNFYFGKLLSQIRPKLQTSVKICPSKAKVMCVPVQFVDLQKLHQPVGKCEGFKMALFDEMVKKAKQTTQKNVEAYPLWEYPCRALASPKVIFQTKFDQALKDSSTFGEISFEIDGTCNGVALWVVYNLDDNIGINSGPTATVQPGKLIQWDMFQQQGVHLTSTNHSVLKDQHVLQYEIDFSSDKYKLNFHFAIVQEDDS